MFTEENLNQHQAKKDSSFFDQWRRYDAHTNLKLSLELEKKIVFEKKTSLISFRFICKTIQHFEYFSVRKQWKVKFNYRETY